MTILRGGEQEREWKMAPDLSEAARSLAVLPLQSCGEVASSSPPSSPSTLCISSGISGGGLQSQENHLSPRPVAENIASRNGADRQFHQPPNQVVGSEAGRGGSGCNENGAETQNSTFINMYYLSPALRATFASVGATAKPYNFKEILLLLKNYLYSKKHLFDPLDILFVNCKNDPLGDVLRVDRFHYNDVRSLIIKNIIRAQPVSLHNVARESVSVPIRANATCSLVTENGSSSEQVKECAAERNAIGARVNNAPSQINGRTEVLVPTSTTTSEHINSIVTSDCSRKLESDHQDTIIHLPGPSRQGKDGPVCRGLCFPDVPDSNSDVESVYSHQGYETALCRNTEFEESDVDEIETGSFEEYEIASDDAREEEHSDDDDSMVEDVDVAVYALHVSAQDESEEDFWADDSDTDDQCLDNDPELAAERWDCLTCGIKNRPFMRYCDKCWQLRKNWLPDRPKKRRRKPRPKKKHSRHRTESIQSDDQHANPEENSLVISNLNINSESSQELEELPRTSSTASTVSLKCDSPPRNFSHGHFSSQDSGISLSQDMLIGFAGGSSLDDSTPKTVDFQIPKTNFSSEKDLSGQGASSKNSTTEETPAANTSGCRKRKLSSSENVKLHKKSKPLEVCDSSEESDSIVTIEMEAKATALSLFLDSAAGREWLRSAPGRQFQSSLSTQGVIIEAISANVNIESSEIDELELASGVSNLCLICCLRPKNGSIIHGRLSHQATCYQCARRLLNSGSRCPVCRRKIHMVCKHIIV
ncbi:E3 ubiquitin-protein ligase Mdm2 isoform X2 [Procambarus clarkii]|uniref:E3 ubiquitin-protein ligase Mdm2 isoform X2 n=1 Tax=Procambarus clarkii TaxID=6728 RepID=UPI001E67216B|nr:E3 ubiquitin-protein ligase Mdm2-like isoform X2 [Procambarus clarkii]